MPEDQPRKSLLLITGMHRSGTSALARVINLMGAGIGNNLIPASPNDNETGFWEQKDAVEINETILENFHTWHLGVHSLPDKWWKNTNLAIHKKSAEDLLMQEHSIAKDVYVLKDPRFSRTMPLWRDAFNVFASVHVILAVRNPLEVARSLFRRNQLPLQEGLALWLLYHLEAERNSRDFSRSWITYGSILTNWHDAILSTSKIIHITLPPVDDSKRAEIEKFLRKDLKHQEISDSRNVLRHEGVDEIIIEAYHQLLEASKSGKIDSASWSKVVKASRKMFSEPENQPKKSKGILANLPKILNSSFLKKHDNKA